MENGHRWGEVATDEQWDDMSALLGEGGPRRHFWLRARGRSKTHDAGSAVLGLMLSGAIRPGDECYTAAAGRDQAGLLARKIRGIAERTPEIAGAIEIQQHKIVCSLSGAVMDVISSDLASSWGRTPRLLFIDEICNHGRDESAKGFVESLLTALPKRRDSVCLAGSTPSAPSHWSFNLWRSAQGDPLWRCSHTSGPAPWQSPEELESERRRLPDSLWRRLFLCQWAEADDALADAESVAACVRASGVLPPRPGLQYVVSFDLSVSSDHTAVSVCHSEVRGGLRVIVVDLVRAWVPRAGRPVDLLDVEAFIGAIAREYGHARVVGDPYQAVAMTQRLREGGLSVRAVNFTAGTNSRRAQMLLRLVRDRAMDLPDDEALRSELLSLRLQEGSTPGVLRLTSESSSGHHDRVTAVMLAAEDLLGQATGNWAEAYGFRLCEGCGRVLTEGVEVCGDCGLAVEVRAAEQVPAGAEPAESNPWMQVYGSSAPDTAARLAALSSLPGQRSTLGSRAGV